MTLINRTTGARVVEALTLRTSFAGRLTGYISCRPSSAPAAIILWDTARVHTLFMAFDLDLYFLDKDLWVLERSLGVRPFQFPRSPVGCRHVLEIPSGPQPRQAIRPGDRLGLLRPRR